jgi:hypothetical protein
MHRKSLAILAGPQDGLGLSRGLRRSQDTCGSGIGNRARAKWFGVFGHRPNPNPRMRGVSSWGAGGILLTRLYVPSGDQSRPALA